MATSRLKNFTADFWVPFMDDEDADFEFKRAEAQKVIDLWEEGLCLSCMAAEVGRDPDMVLVLSIDLLRKGYISNRPGRAYGSCGRMCQKGGLLNDR